MATCERIATTLMTYKNVMGLLEKFHPELLKEEVTLRLPTFRKKGPIVFIAHTLHNISDQFHSS